MKKHNQTFFLSGTFLTIAVMGANVINFVFNAYLGRALSFEAFGVITFLTTFFYIANICYNALITTINHHVSFLEGKNSQNASEHFISSITKNILVISAVIAVLWIISVPFLAPFFHITNSTQLYLFASVLLLYPLVVIAKGYLQGKFFFFLAGIIILIEPLSKLLAAILITTFHQPSLVYTSLYIAPILTLVTTGVILMTRNKRTKQKKNTTNAKHHFPTKFFFAALLTGLSTLSFLALDVILVKHFLPPVIAGEYALLSLIGKIIYFLGSLLNVFIISLVSHHDGKKRSPLIPFYLLLLGTIVFAGFGYIILGICGGTFVPLLFGHKALAIIPYLNRYSATILLFTISNTIVIYHLAKKQLLFPLISFIMSFLLIGGIYIFHQNIQQIISLIFIISIISTGIIALLHIYFAKPLQHLTQKDITVIEEMYE